MRRPDRNVVVLVSGGVDSVVLERWARYTGQISAVCFVNYGQPSVEQERAAVDHYVHRTMPRLDETIGYLETGSLGSGFGLVPDRNHALVCTASKAAKGAGIEAPEIWIGCTDDDYDAYSDCRQQALMMWRRLEKQHGVDVSAPFLGFRRRDVLEMARYLAVDLRNTWSCHKPDSGGKPCGVCNGCERDNGR